MQTCRSFSANHSDGRFQVSTSSYSTVETSLDSFACQKRRFAGNPPWKLGVFKKSLDLELQWLVCSLEGRPPREKFVDGLTEPNRSIFSDICPSGWKCFNKKYNSAHATKEENNQDACPPQHECSPWPSERRCSASWYDRTNKQEPTFWNLGIAGTRWNELQILFEESIRLTLNKLEKQVGYGWQFWWTLRGGWTAWFS